MADEMNSELRARRKVERRSIDDDLPRSPVTPGCEGVEASICLIAIGKVNVPSMLSWIKLWRTSKLCQWGIPGVRLPLHTEYVGR